MDILARFARTDHVFECVRRAEAVESGVPEVARRRPTRNAVHEAILVEHGRRVDTAQIIFNKSHSHHIVEKQRSGQLLGHGQQRRHVSWNILIDRRRNRSLFVD